MREGEERGGNIWCGGKAGRQNTTHGSGQRIPPCRFWSKNLSRGNSSRRKRRSSRQEHHQNQQGKGNLEEDPRQHDESTGARMTELELTGGQVLVWGHMVG